MLNSREEVSMKTRTWLSMGAITPLSSQRQFFLLSTARGLPNTG